MTTWDAYFMSLLPGIARKSKDPSTKCGAIIAYPDHGICSTGFNGFPRRVTERALPEGVYPSALWSHEYERYDANRQSIPERWTDRAIKYLLVQHAERNAIYNAARHGHQTEGCTLYVSAPPCCDCAKGVIQAGIVRVVHAPASPEFAARWSEHLKWSGVMFSEAGVEVVEVEAE